jgi:integrase
MGKSYQQGYVQLRGKKWYGYYRRRVVNPITQNKEEKPRKPVILGLKSKMSKSEARNELQRIINKENGHFGGDKRFMNDGSVTFGWFVRNRYLPMKESDWSEETANNKSYLIQRCLVDDLGSIPLEHFDRFVLQMHAKKLAETVDRNTVLQMCGYLRDIFAEAVDLDFLTKSPAQRLKVPANLRATDKTTLTWEQLRLALNELRARDRLLLELDMTDALRPGELFAFRWNCFDSATATLSIRETVYKGKIRQRAKTEASLTNVPLPADFAADLADWKIQCPDSSPEAFMFPNENGGFLDPDNFRKRVLKELAVRLGLPNLTFQIIRRTIATLGQTMGTIKDLQGVLRHARLPTTGNVYMQVIPAGVRSTVNSISSELRKQPPAAQANSRSDAQPRRPLVTERRRATADLTPSDTKTEMQLVSEAV